MAAFTFPPAMPRHDAAALPADVRLMQASTQLLLVLAGLVFAALALNWLVRQPAFALRAIRIEGEVSRNSVSTIRANALPHVAGNFFTTRLGADRRAFEAVPWVRRAVVRRVWPGQLAVALEEHRAAAIWGGGDAGDRLVNTFGEVFEANVGDVEDDGLPVLTGPEGSSAHMLALLGRLKPVFARVDAGIDALRLSQRGSWHADLDTGAEVEIGRGTDDELVARCERFVATLTQVTGRFQRPLLAADLRHSDGYAVRLKGVTTGATTPNGKKN